LCHQFGRTLSAKALSLALEKLHRASRPIGLFFDRFDVLLTPTLVLPPVTHGPLRPVGIEAALQSLMARLGVGGLLRYGPLLDQAAERTFAFMPFTPTWNATGQPAASLPLHRTPDGLPIGVQAAERFGEETTLLSLAAQLEQLQPWANQIPPGCQ
jgi:amidase